MADPGGNGGMHPPNGVCEFLKPFSQSTICMLFANTDSCTPQLTTIMVVSLRVSVCTALQKLNVQWKARHLPPTDCSAVTACVQCAPELDVGPFFFTQPNQTHGTDTRTQPNSPITYIRGTPTPVL